MKENLGVWAEGRTEEEFKEECTSNALMIRQLRALIHEKGALTPEGWEFVKDRIQVLHDRQVAFQHSGIFPDTLLLKRKISSNSV